MAKSTELAGVRVMLQSGVIRHPIDSGQGQLNRPFALASTNGRVATLETLYDYFINNVPDPDFAMAQDPDFDEKLQQHPDVHACMRIREMTVSSLPVTVQASKKRGINPSAAQTIADYVEDVFEDFPNRTEMYRQMQNAVIMGGQGIEFVWKLVDGHRRPVKFYPVHKSRFLFDRLGNMSLLTRDRPVWGEYVQANPVEMPNKSGTAWKAPRGRFIYHKYVVEGGSWQRPAGEGFVYWGRGEDTNLFIPVTFDNFVLRFRMKWLEKFGIPLAMIHYPQQEGVSSEIQKIADSIRGESVVTIPRVAGENHDGLYHVDFVDPPAGGDSVFASFNDGYTKPRIEKILMGSANGMETDGSSYAGMVKQYDAGSAIIFRFDANTINETINSQLIPDIVESRWPGCPNDYYPKHLLSPGEVEDHELNLNIASQAATMVHVREQDIYDKAGLERPKKGDKTIFLGDQGGDPDMPDMGAAGDEAIMGGSQDKGSIGSNRPRRPVGRASKNNSKDKTPKSAGRK